MTSLHNLSKHSRYIKKKGKSKSSRLNSSQKKCNSSSDTDDGIQCDRPLNTEEDSKNSCESHFEAFNINEQSLSNCLKNKPLALDCEMVGVGERKLSALGRVSIVDYWGNVVYDMYSRPQEEITDYRTPWSGIRKHHMEKAIPLDVVQEQVSRILHERIIVGHMVCNDFNALQMHHPKALVRDTARNPYVKHVAGLPPGKYPVSLKKLTAILFGRNIQESEHCSVEDSRATMAIYRLVEKDWENDLELRGTMKGSHILSPGRQQEDSHRKENTIGKRKRCTSTDKATAAGLISTALPPQISYLNDEFWDSVD